MIQIVYWKEMHRVSVSGHAGSAKKGEDLICAAASMLTYTLAKAVGDLEELGALYEAHIDMEDGKAEISCKPKSRMKHAARIAFDTVMGGFLLLSQKEPGFVSLRVC